ncbi:S8 family serine peptidase [Streptomyces sp. NPDC055721]|uniref:S8 family serine peptidase n=1 Tax=Streptomyces sp. NPDC127132 TaxID=3345374 RepID=UPI003626FA5D
MRRAALIAGMTMAIAGLGATAQVSAQQARPAPLAADYVVVLKDGSKADPAALARGLGDGSDAGAVYRSALRGFSAQLTPEDVDALRAHPDVAYVQAEGRAHMDAQEVPNGVRRTFTAGNTALRTGDGVDQRVNVDVAILDSGTDANHPDLNVARRVSCLGDNGCKENAGYDDNGHGSNVGGIVGGLDNGIGYVGIAPGARLWSVKVLDKEGSGSTSEIVAGIDYVTAHADEIEVANLSLGFDGEEPAVRQAIDRAIAKGVVVVVSAGNDHRDVSAQSPANIPDAITVSALSDADGKAGGLGTFAWCNSKNTDKDDTLADFSNFGAGVDITAPGDCIRSAFKSGGYSNYSGTSQAAPHVAGAAAWLALGSAKPRDRAGVIALRDKLVGAGNLDWTDDSGDGSKERLLDLHDTALFTGGTNGGTSASFAPSCNGSTRTCAFDASASSGSSLTYAWDFGDGTTGTGRAPSHTYAAYGQYTVKLTVTDSSGRTGSNHTTVRVTDPAQNDKPDADFQGFCTVGGSCYADGSDSFDPDGYITSYAWSFGDGTPVVTGEKPSHTYADRTATYTATLTVTDDKGATNSESRTVSCTKGPWYTTCALN